MTAALAQAVPTILAFELRESRSAAQVTAGLARIGEKLSRLFDPLIGQVGVRTIFERSITLARRRVPWLAASDGNADALPWVRLGTSLERQSPSIANQAAECLVAEMVELLGRLIGTALVARLLAEVWPEALPKETT